MLPLMNDIALDPRVTQLSSPAQRSGNNKRKRRRRIENGLEVPRRILPAETVGRTTTSQSEGGSLRKKKSWDMPVEGFHDNVATHGSMSLSVTQVMSMWLVSGVA